MEIAVNLQQLILITFRASAYRFDELLISDCVVGRLVLLVCWKTCLIDSTFVYNVNSQLHIDVIVRSVKTFTYEALHNIVRLINGVSALLLSILPGKASILEGIHGWELRPTFRGPRLPRWMEK